MAQIVPGNSKKPIRLAPLDPNGVKKLEITVTDWLAGATVAQHALTAASGLAIGDGVLAKATNAGVSTPPAPTEASGVITAFVFTDGTETVNNDYKLTISVRASDSKVLDRTLLTEVAHR